MKKYEFFNVKDLTHGQFMILEALLDWPHAAIRSTAFNISERIGTSSSNTSLNLKILNRRGLVIQAGQSCWILSKAVKAMASPAITESAARPLSVGNSDAPIESGGRPQNNVEAIDFPY